MTVLDLINTFREATGYKLAYKTQQPSNIPITNKPRVGGIKNNPIHSCLKEEKNLGINPIKGSERLLQLKL